MKMKATWTIAAAVMVFVLACEPFENGSREMVLELPAEPFSYSVSGVFGRCADIGPGTFL
jgi:hypothetical protein